METAVVTGGTGGVGRAIVAALAREGLAVAFTYRSDAAAAERLQAGAGRTVRGYSLDLLDPGAPELLVERVEAELGTVDALVNNAGVQTQGLLAMTSDADWTRVIDTNLAGLFRCCRAVLPGMVHRRRGAIVNVASLGALRGVAGQSVYAASKAGVLGLTRALAREVGKRRIRVNAVAPGFVRTEMTAELSEAEVAALRQGECLPDGVQAADVAETVAFLLSSRASAITGQCLVVDGGVSA